MESVDVLVVRPPRFYIYGATASIYPQEIYLPTLLEENGILSRFYNSDFTSFLDRKFTLYPDQKVYKFYKRLLKKFISGKDIKWIRLKNVILKTDPKIVLLIPKLPNDFSVTLKAADIIKKVNPTIKVGIYREGKISFQKYLIETMMKSSKNIDFGMIGDAEYTFLELCKNLLKDKKIDKISGVVIRKGKKSVVRGKGKYIDINKLPHPNKDLVLFKEKYPPSSFGLIEESRGCIYNCSFCLASGIPLRFKSPEKVVKEIIEAYERYGTREFHFLGTSFLHSKELAKRVCTLIKKFRLDITFSCYANINQIDEKIVKLMKIAGCNTIAFGLESGASTVLKKMNKISNLLSLKEMKEKIEIIKRNKIKVNTGIIINNPGESLKEIKISINTLKEIKPDFYRVQFLVPFPGTRFYNILKNKGMLVDEKIDEYNTGNIKVTPAVNPFVLQKIWEKHARISDLMDFVLLRKNLLNLRYAILKTKEYLSFFLSSFGSAVTPSTSNYVYL